MNEENSTINLTISGSIFTGFKTPVTRQWALQASHKELIDTVKLRVIRMTLDTGMWKLEHQARDLQLHIHAEIRNDAKDIYICDCEHRQDTHS